MGLHAVTNWVRPGYRGPRLPMQRVCRQLRFRMDDFALEPQTRSSVVFDDARLVFTNDLGHLTEEVRRAFPAQIDGFVRLAERCAKYPPANADTPFVSTRRMLREYLSDPLLIEMLLCPLFFYGSAVEDDVDFEQFIILFDSIYREGFCRPRRGVKQVLDLLVKRYGELGGEMRRRCAVERIEVKDGKVAAIVPEKGEPITADVVLSSAGLVETDRLRDDVANDVDQAGQLTFTETLWVLDEDPRALGFDDCVTFFNQGSEVRVAPAGRARGSAFGRNLRARQLRPRGAARPAPVARDAPRRLQALVRDRQATKRATRPRRTRGSRRARTSWLASAPTSTTTSAIRTRSRRAP